jgi:hypothetical protein
MAYSGLCGEREISGNIEYFVIKRKICQRYVYGEFTLYSN